MSKFGYLKVQPTSKWRPRLRIRSWWVLQKVALKRRECSCLCWDSRVRVILGPNVINIVSMFWAIYRWFMWWRYAINIYQMAASYNVEDKDGLFLLTFLKIHPLVNICDWLIWNVRIRTLCLRLIRLVGSMVCIDWYIYYWVYINMSRDLIKTEWEWTHLKVHDKCSQCDSGPPQSPLHVLHRRCDVSWNHAAWKIYYRGRIGPPLPCWSLY